MNSFRYGNLRRVQPTLCHLIDFITVQHQVGCESVMLVKKDVLVLNGQKLVQGMQVHEQLMLQIMSQRIAAHHLLSLFVQLAIDKNQLKKVKELVGAPSHAKRTPSPKMLYEEGIVLLRREFDQGSHLTVYNSGYVLFSAGKRNTVFHIHDCCGDYAYDAAEGKGDVIEEEYFENCEWHIRALFEGERKMEDNQAKCEGAGRSNVCVSYHALSEDWSEIADRTINMLEKIIENEAVHAMLAVLTDKQRDLIHQQFVLGKTHQEIADDMGISRGSVTRAVNQALERIRRKFDFEAHYELAAGGLP